MMKRGNILNSINLELVCLFFGIISAGTSGIMFTVSGFAVAEFSVDVTLNLPKTPASQALGYGFGIMAITFLGFTMLYSLAFFVLSVLLCYGVCKRKSGYIQAYFIFGTVTEIILISMICFLYTSTTEKQRFEMFSDAMVSISVIAIYGMMLFVIYKTYLKIKEDKIIRTQVNPIVEKC